MSTYTETVIQTDCGDYVEVVTITLDTDGNEVARATENQFKPGTPEHDEPLNQETLADLLHTTLSRIAVRDDLDTDVRDALLLIHRFLHADYSDAEV